MIFSRQIRSYFRPSVILSLFLAIGILLAAPLTQAFTSTFDAVETVSNVAASTVPTPTFAGGTDIANGTIPAITFAGGVDEVKASRTISVNVLPLNTESFSIGLCAVTFTSSTGATSDELNCGDNAATIDLEADLLDTPRTIAEIAAQVQALTNVSDTAPRGALTVAVASPTTISFTTTGTENTAGPVTFTLSAGVGSSVDTSGVIPAPAASTITIIDGLLGSTTADRSITIDGIVIDLGTADQTPAQIAATIDAADFSGVGYGAVATGANVTFTKTANGVAGNGSVVIADASYTKSDAVAASVTITIPAGLSSNATDHLITIDGVAFDLGTIARTANQIAATIAADGFVGKNYTVTNPSGADLTFTRTVKGGGAMNGALTLEDAIYGTRAQQVTFTPGLPTDGETFKATVEGNNYVHTVVGVETVAVVVADLATKIDADAAVNCANTGGTTVTCTAAVAGTPFTFAATVVDVTPPANQDTVFPGSMTKQGGVAVTIVSSGEVTNNVWFAPSGTTVFVAGATMTKAADGVATTILAPATAGAYKLFVLDSTGNISVASTATLTVDNTAPVLAFTAPAVAARVQGSAVISFTNTEPTAPLCSIDNFTTSVACVSGATTLTDVPGFTALGEVGFTLSLRDTDVALNVTTITLALTKDTVAPTAPATPTGSDAFVNSAEKIAGLTITVPLPVGTLTGDTVMLLLGGVAFPTPQTHVLTGPEAAAPSYAFTFAGTELGVDGAKAITARLTDTAGNVGATSAALSFTLDTAAPTASIGYSTANPVKSGAVLTITATFNEVMAVTNTKVAISGANTLGATDMTYADTTHASYGHTVGAGNGAATIALSVGTDLAGNPITAVPTAGDTFVVDNIVPALSSVTIASNNSNNTALAKVSDLVTVLFTSNEAISTPSATIAGQVATISSLGGNAYSASFTMTGAQSNDPAIDFSIAFSDLAGNAGTAVVSTTDASIVTFDKTAPVLLQIAPIATPTNDNTPSYSFSTTEVGTIVYGGSCASVTTAAALGANSVTFNTLADAAYSNCTVTVSDAAGNPSLALAVTAFTVDTTAPTILSVTSSLGNGSYTVGQVVPVTVTFSEAVTSTGSVIVSFDTGGSCSFSISGAASGGCSYTVAGAQTSADLTTTGISGTVNDAAANTVSDFTPVSNLAATSQIVIDTTVPTVSSIDITSPANGAYTIGTQVDVAIGFSENVVVAGTPTLALNSGGSANYLSGTGSNSLVFRYTVAAGNTSADLDYTGTGSLTLAGGTINDGAANPATLTLPVPGAIATGHDIIIDTTAPTAPAAPTAAAGPFINAAEEIAGFPVVVSLAGTGAVAGDTLKLLLGGVAFPAPLTHVLTAPEAAGTYSFNVATTQLGANGVKSITATITDVATNVSVASAALSLTLDTVAPAAPTVSSIATDNKINNAEKAAILVAGTAEADALVSATLTDVSANAKNATQQLTLGATAFSISVDGTTALPGAFVDGVVLPSVIATDAAGNVSAATVLPAVVQDTVAPAVPVIVVTNPVNAGNVTAGSLTGTGEGSTVATYTITDSGAGVVANTSTLTAGGALSVAAINLSTLADGALTFSVTLTDGAGNISTAATAPSVKDVVLPTFTPVAPANSAFINNVTTASQITYTLSENIASGTILLTNTGGTADAGSPHSCALVGTAKNAGAHALNLADTVNGCAVAQTLVEKGQYSVAFDGTDAVGNASVTITRTAITFDSVAPVVTITNPQPSVSTATTLTLALSTDETAICSYGLDFATSTMATTGGVSHSQAIGPLVTGVHTLAFSCVDPSTNTRITNNQTFTVFATSGSTLSTNGSNASFDSPTAGAADLPPGITVVGLSNATVVDLSGGASTLSAGSITLSGASQSIGSITTGDLVGANLTTLTTGDQTLTIEKAVVLESGTPDVPVTFTNADFPGASVSIPDGTAIFSSSGWDGTIAPERFVNTVGIQGPAGFKVNDQVFVGASVPIFFSKPVTIIMPTASGPAAYKPAGSSSWVAMNQCSGSFAAPVSPVFSGECYIANSTQTKIVTYHLTAFGQLEPLPASLGGASVGGGNGPVSQSGGGGGGGSTAGATFTTPQPSQPAQSVSQAPSAPQGAVLGVSIFRFTRGLSFGSRGTDVKELQKILAAEGFFKGDFTTYFGPVTRAALRLYQKKHGIDALGLVGPKTRAMLNLGAKVSQSVSSPLSSR
ncbi:MAG: peptidoglycan-binding protein [Patescibacteria group bacterium]